MSNRDCFERHGTYRADSIWSLVDELLWICCADNINDNRFTQTNTARVFTEYGPPTNALVARIHDLWTQDRLNANVVVIVTDTNSYFKTISFRARTRTDVTKTIVIDEAEKRWACGAVSLVPDSLNLLSCNASRRISPAAWFRAWTHKAACVTFVG